MANTSPPTSAPRKKPLLSRTSTAVKSSGRSAVSGSATKKKGRKNLPFFSKKLLTNNQIRAIIQLQKRDKKEANKMIRNTYYKVMNERDEVFTTTDSLREAKKVAKATAIERKEWIWVIDVLNDNEVVMYEEDGKEF
jgi:hypothetical protein